MLSLCPAAVIVDITHSIAPHDIAAAARVLAEAVPSFQDAIHLAVVDPGVGSARRRIILEADVYRDDRKIRTLLIGPDNGIFALAAPRDNRARAWEIAEVSRLSSKSLSTFDGRDVFAPAAGLIACGASPASLGPAIDCSSLVDLEQPVPSIDPHTGDVCGEIFQIDRFGNAISNISGQTACGGEVLIEAAGGERRLSFVQCYQEIPEAAVAWLINSQGLLEAAAREQSASKLLGISPGVKVVVRKQRNF